MPDFLYVNNAAEGFAGPKSVSEGLTLKQLFSQDMPATDMNTFLVKVNNTETQDLDATIEQGMKVVVTPRNMEGAG